MRFVIRSSVGDRYGQEVGYLTDSPGFTYHLEEDAPDRAALVEVLDEVAARETRPAYGGAADEDAVCGGYGRAPATDHDRLVMAVQVLSSGTFPVHVEEDGPK